jgi:carnitine 3-dehydrogenase
MTSPDQVERIVVLGAGTIGASWAAWYLSRSIRVAVYDPTRAAESYVRRYVAEAWPMMARLGMATHANPEAWTFTADPAEAVREAQFIQENAPERANTKRELYAAIKRALREHAISPPARRALS